MLYGCINSLLNIFVSKNVDDYFLFHIYYLTTNLPNVFTELHDFLYMIRIFIKGLWLPKSVCLSWQLLLDPVL